MSELKKFFLASAIVLLLGMSSVSQANTVSEQSVMESLLDGHKVVNIVDDFLAFWDRAKDYAPQRQRRLWRRMVEKPHRQYFERAVYRGADAEQKRAMLDWFLAIVPDRIDAIREFNRGITYRLAETVVFFKSRFPEYRQQQDIYIGLSMFGFDGSVRAVHNDEGLPDTLCLAADMLAGYSAKQLRIAITHEFFHLYHFGFLFQEPSLSDLRKAHIRLLVEGMAVAGAEAIYPYEPSSLYLHFSDEELFFQQAGLTFSSQRYLSLIREDASPERYEEWFTSAPGRETPLRGGYLLGYEVAKRVLAAFTLEQMARMTPAQLREHAEEQLAAMTTDGVIMMAASG